MKLMDAFRGIISSKIGSDWRRRVREGGINRVRERKEASFSPSVPDAINKLKWAPLYRVYFIREGCLGWGSCRRVTFWGSRRKLLCICLIAFFNKRPFSAQKHDFEKRKHLWLSLRSFHFRVEITSRQEALKKTIFICQSLS